jgi:pimeloyl-[acyl-carrier protein] methyl ester esterase
MELVFIHGWGFDARFWDALAPLLPAYKQQCVDMGFFDQQINHPPLAGGSNLQSKFGEGSDQETPSPAKTNDLLRKSKFSLPLPQGERDKILIGHSLGFMHGIRQRQDWKGWIAINSFPRFAGTCVPGFILREMRKRLESDPAKTLSDFGGLIGAELNTNKGNIEHLLQGLDTLRDEDIGDVLGTRAMPGLVLASHNDPIVPDSASELLGDFAHDIGWHDDGGHMLPQTYPAWCAQKITKFLKDTFNA